MAASVLVRCRLRKRTGAGGQRTRGSGRWQAGSGLMQRGSHATAGRLRHGGCQGLSCRSSEPGDRDLLVDAQLTPVHSDALDLPQRFGSQVALSATPAMDDRHTLDQERGPSSAEGAGHAPSPGGLLPADVADHGVVTFAVGTP